MCHKSALFQIWLFPLHIKAAQASSLFHCLYVGLVKVHSQHLHKSTMSCHVCFGLLICFYSPSFDKTRTNFPAKFFKQLWKDDKD